MGMEEEWKARKIVWKHETRIEMRELLQVKKASAPLAPWTSKDAYLSSVEGRIASVEGRAKIFQKGVKI